MNIDPKKYLDISRYWAPEFVVRYQVNTALLPHYFLYNYTQHNVEEHNGRKSKNVKKIDVITLKFCMFWCLLKIF